MGAPCPLNAAIVAADCGGKRTGGCVVAAAAAAGSSVAVMAVDRAPPLPVVPVAGVLPVVLPAPIVGCLAGPGGTVEAFPASDITPAIVCCW